MRGSMDMDPTRFRKSYRRFISDCHKALLSKKHREGIIKELHESFEPPNDESEDLFNETAIAVIKFLKTAEGTM
jgi:hypothetical protein